VSKAFTKEDDDAGVAIPASRSLLLPEGPFRITARGAAWLASATDPRLRELVNRAEVLPPAPAIPDRVALGVTVRARGSDGAAKTYLIVTAAEQALRGEGCSVESPVGRALLGARVGDVREIRTPRGQDELEILDLQGDA
jgi:transcription elongation GreA/GreB family factor